LLSNERRLGCPGRLSSYSMLKKEMRSANGADLGIAREGRNDVSPSVAPPAAGSEAAPKGFPEKAMPISPEAEETLEWFRGREMNATVGKVLNVLPRRFLLEVSRGTPSARFPGDRRRVPLQFSPPVGILGTCATSRGSTPRKRKSSAAAPTLHRATGRPSTHGISGVKAAFRHRERLPHPLHRSPSCQEGTGSRGQPTSLQGRSLEPPV
jgi:hypothetical protein